MFDRWFRGRSHALKTALQCLFDDRLARSVVTVMDPRVRHAKDIHFSLVGARLTLWRSAVERKASTSVLSADGAAPCKTTIR